MSGRIRKRLDHEVPSWVDPASVFFVTVCAEPRNQNHLCREQIGELILDSIRFRHEKEDWFCELALLMPDHVHLLVSFPEDRYLITVMGAWKRWLSAATQINWQRNFFDHRLRSEESLSDKANYILNNPVRAGLVEKAELWPYIWMPSG